MALRCLASISVLSSLILVAPAAGAPTLEFTALEFPDATSTLASGINNAGQICGWYMDATERSHGFLYDGETFATLDFPEASDTYADTIDDAGRICGRYRMTPDGETSCFRHDGTGFAPLSLNLPGATKVTIREVNAAGWMCGTWMGRGEEGLLRTSGFLASGEAYTVLDVPESRETGPSGINTAGRVCGVYVAQDGIHAFVYDGRAFSTVDFPGAIETKAYDINRAGWICGSYRLEPRGPLHGFLLNGRDFIAVDFPGAVDTVAQGLDDTGCLVGLARCTDGRYRAWIARPAP